LVSESRCDGLAASLARLLPEGTQTLRIESAAASPDGLAGIAATVRAPGPAVALRDVSRLVEIIAAEAGRLDDLGPMRRCFVELVDYDAAHGRP
jgi:hypothetical protein